MFGEKIFYKCSKNLRGQILSLNGKKMYFLSLIKSRPMNSRSLYFQKLDKKWPLKQLKAGKTLIGIGDDESGWCYIFSQII